jgi:predicted heme/steroid binding protein
MDILRLLERCKRYVAEVSQASLFVDGTDFANYDLLSDIENAINKTFYTNDDKPE